MDFIVIAIIVLFVFLFYKLIRFMEKKEEKLRLDSITKFHEDIDRRTKPQK